MRFLLVLMMMIFGGLTLTACGQDGPFEETGEEMDDAVDEVDDAADEIEDASEGD